MVKKPCHTIKNQRQSLQWCKALVISAACIVFGQAAHAQRYLADFDSTLFVRDTLRPFLKRMENVYFSGYIQPQYQVAQQKGAPSFEGGNFSEFSNNRFMLRRARIKVDYLVPSKNGGAVPLAIFTFQFDATEKGVNARDVFVRVYPTKKQNISLTTGLFARPFGYEVNLSSSYRESPERGRMSQTLMTTERDLGFMFTYDQLATSRKLPFKFDAGVFNGQGLSGTTDFDSYKDIISRFTLKPLHLSQSLLVSGGASLLYGGWRQATIYKYEMGTLNNNAVFVVDSSSRNLGAKAPRHYYGADVQLVKKNTWGKTELRGEYWWGKQPGTAATTLNPGTLPLAPTYIRNFDGAFFYLLQNIVNDKWEVMAKYDWYDPNRNVKDLQIGKAQTNLTAGDIKFTTLGLGATHYINSNLKVLLYYDIVRNETTQLTGFAGDIKDNILTCRMQLRF